MLESQLAQQIRACVKEFPRKDNKVRMRERERERVREIVYFRNSGFITRGHGQLFHLSAGRACLCGMHGCARAFEQSLSLCF